MRTTAEVQRFVALDSPTHRQDTSNTVLVSDCDASTVTVRGSFVLALWQYDAVLSTATETRNLPSGTERSTTLPAPVADAAYPSVGHGRQQFLYVTDGTLTIPNLSGATNYVFLDHANVAASTLTLHQATGQLNVNGQAQAIQANVLRLDGDLAADLAKTDDGLRTFVGGHLDAASADGQLLTQTVQPAGSASHPWTWALWLGVLVVLAALAAPARVGVRRARGSLTLARLKRVNADDSDTVYALATQAIQLHCGLGFAHLARAGARIRQGDIEGSLQDCEHAWTHLPPNHDLRAAAARQGVAASLILREPALRDAWLHRMRST